MSRDDPTYNRVSSRFWAEARSEDWTDDMALLGAYILTCDHRTTEGIYYLPREYMVGDLPDGWDLPRLDACLAPLLDHDFLRYDFKARVAFIPKAMKYQRPDTPQQQKSAIRNIRNLPKTPLLADLFEAAEAFAKPFHQALLQAIPQGLEQAMALGKASRACARVAPAPAPAPAPTPTQESGPNSDESAPTDSPKAVKVKAPDWQSKADALLEKSRFPSDLMQLSEILAAENKTGKVALSRVVSQLYEPLVALQSELSDAALRHGLRAAITNMAPNANYVRKAALKYVPCATASAAKPTTDYDDLLEG